jgi:apolipoprotein N-acyltransferase
LWRFFARRGGNLHWSQNPFQNKENAMNALKLSAIALCLALPFAAHAAEERTAEQKVAHKLEKMTEKLGLSAEQQDKLKSQLLAKEKSREAERAEERKQLEAVLTPEQLAKLDAEPKKHKGEGKKHKDCKRAE